MVLSAQVNPPSPVQRPTKRARHVLKSPHEALPKPSFELDKEPNTVQDTTRDPGAALNFEQEETFIQAHKPLPTGKKANCNTNLTVICANVPEPTANTLREKQAEELNHWLDVCKQMGINVHPVGIVRLFRHPSSPHAGEPRLTRITFAHEKDLEKVILSSYLLDKNSCKSRIFLDRPWTERAKYRTNPTDARESENKRVVLIHGVPQLSNPDEALCQQNDCKEWDFIRELINCSQVLTVRISRLPSSPNYHGNGPRIMKVTLGTEEMANAVLEAWKNNRKRGPPELRIRSPHSIGSIQSPRAITDTSTLVPSTSEAVIPPQSMSGTDEVNLTKNQC